MNMKKIIHEELGQELENIGFHYGPPERLFWTYEREKDGIKQEILLARDRYFKGQIRVFFQTSAYGRQKPKQFRHFVPEEGAKQWDVWQFNNEEELRKVLKEFKRLIFTYGLDFLESISKPTTDAIPTEEKQRYLYMHHQELYEQWQKELETGGKSAEEVIDIIFQKMEKTLDKPYAEVEDMLMGLAALYGHTICWGDRGEWIWLVWNQREFCQIKKVLGTWVNVNVLYLVTSTWDHLREHRDKKKNYLLDEYREIMRDYYIKHPEERP